MNDEPIIRLRARKSKHGPNENPRKYTGVLRSMLRIVQMCFEGKRLILTDSLPLSSFDAFVVYDDTPSDAVRLPSGS